MGYTHYWTQTRSFTPQEMRRVVSAVQDIVKASGVAIAGWDGSGSPEFTVETIGFNGKDDESCETFRINAEIEGNGWAFCKTRGRPYDVVVTACLTVLAAKHGFKLGSDGDANDWEEGVKLASKALGEIFKNPRREQAA
jgi:hypothetical protein